MDLIVWNDPFCAARGAGSALGLPRGPGNIHTTPTLLYFDCITFLFFKLKEKIHFRLRRIFKTLKIFSLQELQGNSVDDTC